jgi:diadenosine tetraphosphate (Ap4A) HIT family hydrolase
VVANAHYENAYDIPDDVLAHIQIVGKRIAVAMEATDGCERTSFRQHNGPGTEVSHSHLHVIPRHVGIGSTSGLMSDTTRRWQNAGHLPENRVNIWSKREDAIRDATIRTGTGPVPTDVTDQANSTGTLGPM